MVEGCESRDVARCTRLTKSVTNHEAQSMRRVREKVSCRTPASKRATQSLILVPFTAAIHSSRASSLEEPRGSKSHYPSRHRPGLGRWWRRLITKRLKAAAPTVLPDSKARWKPTWAWAMLRLKPTCRVKDMMNMGFRVSKQARHPMAQQ